MKYTLKHFLNSKSLYNQGAKIEIESLTGPFEVMGRESKNGKNGYLRLHVFCEADKKNYPLPVADFGTLEVKILKDGHGPFKIIGRPASNRKNIIVQTPDGTIMSNNLTSEDRLTKVETLVCRLIEMTNRNTDVVGKLTEAVKMQNQTSVDGLLILKSLLDNPKSEMEIVNLLRGSKMGKDVAVKVLLASNTNGTNLNGNSHHP